MRPITSSLVGLTTSIVAVPAGSTHSPPMNSLSRVSVSVAMAMPGVSLCRGGRRRGAGSRYRLARAVGQGHDRDHRVGARGGGERARVAYPHTGRVVQLAVGVGHAGLRVRAHAAGAHL